MRSRVQACDLRTDLRPHGAPIRSRVKGYRCASHCLQLRRTQHSYVENHPTIEKHSRGEGGLGEELHFALDILHRHLEALIRRLGRVARRLQSGRGVGGASC